MVHEPREIIDWASEISAIQAGFITVTCACDEQGNVDMDDLRAKAEENKEELAALMITYPSTHGIFETEIKDICHIIP